ncbi:MAG: DUF4198 domain-containing protein, partial [Bacteroidota bacterium]
MRKILFLMLVAVLCSSHDMFLKLDTFFLNPEQAASIQLFNGTFEKSDNTIDRNRMLDVSLVGNGERMRVDSNQWAEVGETTVLNFRTGKSGTWVAGVSTRARDFGMDAEAFNNYLEHDGVLDVLEDRRQNGKADQAANERYSKHVKTIFQVGDKRTNDWKTNLGYPIEFIPLSNPYNLHAGFQFKVRLLRAGEPLAGQLVYAGSNEHGHDHDHEHDHEHGEDHDHHTGVTQLKTDARGELTMDITHDGIWYLRTIHLVETEEAGLTHESNWATLTFEVAGDEGHAHHDHDHDHGHDHDHEHGHDHDHDHEHGDDHDHSHDHEEDGIPFWIFGLMSLVVVGGLFLYFN